jgi:hypothetical protein
MLPGMARLRLLGCAALVVILGSLVPGCTSSSGCTEIGCESEAIVTFPAGLVSGAYDLVLEGEGETVTARCLDPGAPETAENPEGLTCTADRFELLGHPLANERELVVTLVPYDASGEMGEPVSETVRLDAIEEITPNGPNCPPICVVRNGQLRLPDPEG